MSKARALVLFSGGLDSLLAIKVLEEQGIEVVAICFVSNFYNSSKAEEAAELYDIKLIKADITEEMLELTKNPPSGYGKHLNPCVDCHALMVKKAGEVAKEQGFDIVATGEVLGQRPFSQNRESLARVKELSGVDVLRPLSAKRLDETDVERLDIVRRGRLLALSGRSRERQFELAKKYQLDKYATPAGGCILTDPEFSTRLGYMLDYWPKCSSNDIELLINGRVFWFKSESSENGEWVIIIVGRHDADNQNLAKLAQKGDIMVELKEITGPNTLVRGLKKDCLKAGQKTIEIPEKLKMSELKVDGLKTSEEIIQIASLLTGHYATKARGKSVKIVYNI